MQMNIISTKPKRINKVLAFTLFLATLAYFFYWQQQIQKAERIKMYKESLFNQYRDVYDAYHYSKYNEFWNKLTSKDIQRYRQEWQDFVNTIPPRQPGVGKQGIVYTAHSNIARMAIVSIQMLRKNNCSLPVEVFHYGDELAETDVKALKSLPGVMVKDLIPLTQNSLKKGNDEKMFEAKGAALIHSEFDQLLFLDSDNVAVIDPTFLFSSQAFLETGAIFWKDFWKTRPDNPIYEILDIEFRDNYEQESGQLLLDKSRPEVWKALNFAFYMQRHKELYFKLLNGDKDTFNYAWQALKVPFHMVTPHVAIAGVGTDRICGHTVIFINIRWFNLFPYQYRGTRYQLINLGISKCYLCTQIL